MAIPPGRNQSLDGPAGVAGIADTRDAQMTDLSPTVGNRRRWTIVGLLFASGFINYLDRAILSVALPVIAIDPIGLNLGPAAKGVLLSAFFWSYAVMQLPMGWCCDRYNLRWIYAGAFTLWALACGFTGFASALGTLIVLRILLGVGESVYLPGGIKVVSMFFDSKDRVLASGLVNSGTRAGLALGAVLIALARYSLRLEEFFLSGGFWLSRMACSLALGVSSAYSVVNPA
jgi:MFS transporter, ACS family, D-galactonate transporter